jgi:beta-ribofuranosylaminobenzene 5'-phosphate synthase
MPVPTVEVIAPSRLHFGMFSFGQPGARQFGGAGVMIDRPGLTLRMSGADRFTAAGPLAPRVESIVGRLADAWQMTRLPACRIEVVDAPPEHVGLGTGTQLALSVTAGLNAWRGGEPLDAISLAKLSGRGTRSAIGTYGFLHGGFLVESGKTCDEVLSPLAHRAALPRAWRFVVIIPHGEHGLSGEAEASAFHDLPPVPTATSEQLRREVSEEMVPAAGAGDFARFSRSVDRFGRSAGMCFAARQGGPFASGPVARIVEAIGELGVQGAGQSSWGPSVFALLESELAALRFADAMQARLDPRDAVIVSKPNQTGARIARG